MEERGLGEVKRCTVDERDTDNGDGSGSRDIGRGRGGGRGGGRGVDGREVKTFGNRAENIVEGSVVGVDVVVVDGEVDKGVFIVSVVGVVSDSVVVDVVDVGIVGDVVLESVGVIFGSVIDVDVVVVVDVVGNVWLKSGGDVDVDVGETVIFVLMIVIVFVFVFVFVVVTVDLDGGVGDRERD